MKNTLKISEVKYFLPISHIGHPLQEYCKFKGVDENGGIAIFFAYGKYARKLMRKIISKKKVVCFCSFCTFSTPSRDQKGATVSDAKGNQVITSVARFVVKKILDYNPKTTYSRTDTPIWIFPFLFTYPKVQRRKRINKRDLTERLFPIK